MISSTTYAEVPYVNMSEGDKAPAKGVFIPQDDAVFLLSKVRFLRDKSKACDTYRTNSAKIKNQCLSLLEHSMELTDVSVQQTKDTKKGFTFSEMTVSFGAGVTVGAILVGGIVLFIKK